ncbi:MAG TPA: RsmE family RNA methyltransferase [Treponemataceae bacterium]|nr:RsmE family RNA methyltransferase [Treponemataceae bacterium]
MRQYISAKMPDEKGNLRIYGKDCHYMQQVLRLKRDDSLDMRFPDGKLLLMKAVSFTKKYIEFSIALDSDISSERGVSATNLEKTGTAIMPCEESIDGLKIRGCEYWILQFMPRPQKMDQIIRQAVECGVAYIVPVKGSFSPLAALADRTERWNRIIKEALQQSGSAVKTEVLRLQSLQDAINVWKNNLARKDSDCNTSCAFVLDEDPTKQECLFKKLTKKPQKAVIAIGCEGGISKDELQLLHAAGFESIHFNTNILRAETAALYGIAALQHAVMEFESWK